MLVGVVRMCGTVVRREAEQRLWCCSRDDGGQMCRLWIKVTCGVTQLVIAVVLLYNHLCCGIVGAAATITTTVS